MARGPLLGSDVYFQCLDEACENAPNLWDSLNHALTHILTTGHRVGASIAAE